MSFIKCVLSTNINELKVSDSSNERYCFQVTDNSMEATNGVTFPINSYIWMDALRTPKPMDFVIAKPHPAKLAIFRQLVFKNNQLYLCALNSNYSDQLVTQDTEIYGVICQSSKKT